MHTIPELYQDFPPPEITFTKWIDPLKAIFDKHKKNKDKGFDDDDSNEFSELYDYNGPAINTIQGIIPLNETTLPSTVFKFYRADTNFFMTNYCRYIIETTLGVETFDLITPYRWRIAVATRFNDADVQDRIRNRVYAYINHMRKTLRPEKIDSGRNLLSKQYKFWAIVEDTIKKVIHGNTKQEVEEKLAEYIKLHPDAKISKSW